jgi:hypothetical protein
MRPRRGFTLIELVGAYRVIVEEVAVYDALQTPLRHEVRPGPQSVELEVKD